MNFYIILPFIFLFIYLLKYYQDKVNLNITNKKIELLICIPFLVFASFRGFMPCMGDTRAYMRHIDETSLDWSYLTNIPILETHEIGYKYILFFLNQICSSHIFIFFVFALVTLFCYSYFFKKHSVNYFYSMFMFVFSYSCASWLTNGMRQGFVMAIIYAIAPLFFNKKYILYIGIVLLLVTVHNTAMFIIPAMFACNGKIFNKKILLFLIFMVFVCILTNVFLPIFTKLLPYYGDSLEQFTEAGNGMNYMRFVFYSIPTFIAIINYKYIKNKNDMFLNFCVNMSIITSAVMFFACSTSGVLIGRLAAYYSFYNFILLPWELKYLFNKKIFKIDLYIVANLSIIIIYMIFYFYFLYSKEFLYIHHFEVY